MILRGNLSPLMSLISRVNDSEHALAALTVIGKHEEIPPNTASMIISILLDSLANSAGDHTIASFAPELVQVLLAHQVFCFLLFVLF